MKSDGIDNVAILSWASNPYDASKKAIKMASLVLKSCFKPREEMQDCNIEYGTCSGWCILGCILRESESEKDWERVDESAKRGIRRLNS